MVSALSKPLKPKLFFYGEEAIIQRGKAENLQHVLKCCNTVQHLPINSLPCRATEIAHKVHNFQHRGKMNFFATHSADLSLEITDPERHLKP